MSDFSFRPMTVDDHDYLSQIICGTLSEIGANANDPLFQQLAPDYQKVCCAHASDLLGRKKGVGFIAEVEGEPAGLIFGETQPPWLPVSQIEHIGYIEALWVEPEHRRSGLARALVAHLEQAFKQDGVELMELNFHLDNPTAEPFWESLGYRSTRVRAQKSI